MLFSSVGESENGMIYPGFFNDEKTSRFWIKCEYDVYSLAW